MRPWSWSLVLAAGVLFSSGLASAAPPVLLPPSPDLAGHGSGKSLGKAVAKAATAARVRLATSTELNRAASASGVSLQARLTLDQGAKLASAGNFAGVVLFRKASAGAFAQFVDPRGQVVLERLIHLKRGAASDSDAAVFAAALSQALTPAPPPPIESTPSAVLAARIPPPPPRVPTPLPPPESAETVAALAGPEAAPVKSTEPAAGYYFRVGLLAGPAERRFLTPSFRYTSGYPYLVSGATVELFPFHGFGLGLMGDFTFGRVTDEAASGTGTFLSNDVRFDAALAYRLRLFAGPHGTFLIPRVGIGLRDFEAPKGVGLVSADRLFMIGGLAVTQPIVPRYLRVTGGVAALPFSRFGNAAQLAYGNSSAFGLEWNAELAGDIAAGLEWALQAEQERFMDGYKGPPFTRGIDIYTTYTLQLRYRL